MAPDPPPTTTDSKPKDGNTTNPQQERRQRSIFELPPDFFDFCQLISSPHSSLTSIPEPVDNSKDSSAETLDVTENVDNGPKNVGATVRWTCNTCKAEFESLQDQRSHFKSDIHRFNVKLCIAGKNIVNEEDFDELTSDSFNDYDISSISGSEDEASKGFGPSSDLHRGTNDNFKQKISICLNTGERVSVWKSLLMNESENLSADNDFAIDYGACIPCSRENEVSARLKSLIREPRDNTHLRILLLASGGHFVGCVFDGNSVIAHKTFHRYVVRAKAGKKQSSKDAGGKTVHSAGASLRRYNELALKKDIQELLVAWKPYFDASSCIFIYAPSNNRQLLFNGEKPYFSHQHCVVKSVPLTVRRPTFKEAKRIYNQLTRVAYELDEKEIPVSMEDSCSSMSTINNGSLGSSKEDLGNKLGRRENVDACSSNRKSDELSISSESEAELTGRSTPLHEAALSGDAHKVLELLEQGLDPCCKDERGRTPYMLASDKEVRNSFRRFMASNLDKWDWHAAKVPSALTKEMEESQAAKQAEKDAKKKARAKELKKLRKAKEKKDQSQAALNQKASRVVEDQGASTSVLKGSQSSSGSHISKEEELKRKLAAEREKRAAAAERRIAAATVLNNNPGISVPIVQSTSSQVKSGSAGDIHCSCCNTSLAGKVPFHRYNFKYCSTSCMHVHREILEDE